MCIPNSLWSCITIAIEPHPNPLNLCKKNKFLIKQVVSVASLKSHGVFRIKCAGRKNLNTNHLNFRYKIGIIFSLVTVEADILFAAAHTLPKVVSKLSLAMVRTTPSQLVMKLSWDNERLASSEVTLRQNKKSAGAVYLCLVNRACGSF
jgi:hypothetical protein